ncbi:MAG: DUF2330 domain-containing protein [Myxococcales bacterium]
MRALTLAAAAATLAIAPRAPAFCGFFVGKADAKLFNKSSQVAMVRDGNRTVLTMSNDYQGPLDDFALVVPVPSVLERDQIHIGDRRLLERLDEYSSPRLVEYTDPDPCEPRMVPMSARMFDRSEVALAGGVAERSKALGVTVEAAYTVGEYDILLLSAKESRGLEIWLRQSGYQIPPRAARALEPYVKQEMKFFVAKVNLKEQKKTGYQELRPIQIAFDSPRFMLPIRLGMANAPATGETTQDLIVYTLTRKGRVEASNYQTVKIPSDADVPEFVKDEFADFYRATFTKAWHERDGRAVFTEYAWNMGWCDPCSAAPLTAEELRGLGVFWAAETAQRWGGQGGGTILTRLHVRYDEGRFPEDLMFQETGDQQSFQGRYVMHHPFRGETSCEAADRYRTQVTDRRRGEADTLARLTGWSPDMIRDRMGRESVPESKSWWKRLWQ